MKLCRLTSLALIIFGLNADQSNIKILLATHFSQVGLSASHFFADWLPMIGATTQLLSIQQGEVLNATRAAGWASRSNCK